MLRRQSTSSTNVLRLSSFPALGREFRPYKPNPDPLLQDFIVHDVRRVLYETISAFDGSLEEDINIGEFIQKQLASLRRVLSIREEASEFADLTVASKILNW